MVELLRTGPGIVLIETHEKEKLQKFYGVSPSLGMFSLEDAFSTATEGETIVLITPDDRKVLRSSEDRNAVILPDEPSVILSNLISSGMSSFVNKTKIVSRTIIMRTMGDMERVFDELQEDYHGIEGSIMEFINSNLEQGVIIALTDKSLNRQVTLGDIYMEKCLLINENYFTIFKELRSNALKYLNSGLGNKVWYEMDIRIYDMYGAFKLHYERLINVLTELEMGIVLGSSWSKDYPKMLLAVDVYSVRFFSFYEPHYIKKVDYDLYMGKKKISWRDLTKDRKMTRDILGMQYRKETLSNLTHEEEMKIYEMEEKVMKTRIR